VLVNIKEISHPGIQVPTTMVHGTGIMATEPNAPMPGVASDHWQIGALTTIAEIAAHPEIQAKLPGLADAAAQVGSPQIRNVATLGGNLLQHSRCWYYRQPDIVCLKRGGDKCYAPEGENKYLALFSGCACVTAFTSNLGVILSALGAEAIVIGPAHPSGGAPMPLRELYAKAWSDPRAAHSLRPTDFLVSVRIPFSRARSAYRQQSEKSEFDWALVSCGAAGNVNDGRVHDVDIALGGLAPIPHRAAEAHHYLEGKPLNEETASHAADLILKDAKPLSQNGYKIPLAHTLIRRTLLALNP
jgi:xanthine dehydrogenase YagS FAD-binding subunit